MKKIKNISLKVKKFEAIAQFRTMYGFDLIGAMLAINMILDTKEELEISEEDYFNYKTIFNFELVIEDIDIEEQELYSQGFKLFNEFYERLDLKDKNSLDLYLKTKYLPIAN